MGVDLITLWAVCEDFGEVWGDIPSTVRVLEQQWEWAEKYYETGGWSLNTVGPAMSGGIAR